jgi:hypothetical protein
MSVDLAGLFSRGYLPKEVPPIFASGEFSTYASRWAGSFAMNKYTEGTKHNLRRAGGARRGLTIPHPLAYVELARSIDRNWTSIDGVFSRSPFVASIPVANPGSAGREYVPSFYFGQRARERARSAIGARFVLVGDLSQCYSSIYTHSIPWALEGKEISKNKLRDNLSATITGNDIDVRSQRVQLRQTKGIPVGPDTSFILGELILSSIDIIMCEDLDRQGNHRSRGAALRITDDFEYYASTRGEAEAVWLAWEKAANHFELQVNPLKTEIRELPEALESNWTISLTQMVIRFNSVTSLVQYFSRVRDLAREHSSAAIFSYAINRVNGIDWVFDDDDAWSAYSDLILTSIVTEPAAIHASSFAFDKAEFRGRSLDREAMENTFNEIVSFHCDLEHGSEVCWSMHILRRFELKLRAEIASRVALMDDNLSLILLRLLIDESRVDGPAPDMTVFESRAEKPDALSTSDWLLSYEAAAQGWTSTSAFAGEPEMLSMLEAGVSFLDRAVKSSYAAKPLSAGPASEIDWLELMHLASFEPTDLMGSVLPDETW